MVESDEVGELLREDVAECVDFEPLVDAAEVEGDVLVRSGAKRGLISAEASIDVVDGFAAEGEEGGGRLVVLRRVGLSIVGSMIAIG